MRTIAIIPARLESHRLPRKALLDIRGLPMIVHVLKRSLLAEELSDVFVATDNSEIRQTVESYGGKVIMTKKEHQTGTDRIAEAAGRIDCDIVINVQGDEALLNPKHIDEAVRALKENSDASIVMPVTPFYKLNSPSDIKVVIDCNGKVLYFSRSDIPSPARYENPPMLKACHLIPFRKNFLLQYAAWPKGRLEQVEFNEYLRILEKGYKIQSLMIDKASISVDTPEDLEEVRTQMANDTLIKSYK